MTPSQRAVDLIKQCEGCRLEAYQDAVGIWSIGYGDTEDVHSGMKITQEQADFRLTRRLAVIASLIKPYIRVELNQNQFDACVCLAYNIGPNAFKYSTLLKYLNVGQFQQAAEEFGRWNKAGGKVLPGLVNRRKLEEELFLS